MKKKVLFLLFAILSFSAKAELLDSLLQALKSHPQQDTTRAYLLNEIAWEYTYTDNELSMNYAREALKLSEKLNYLNGIGSAWNAIGINQRTFEKFPEAIEAFNKNIQTRRTEGRIHKIPAGFINIGNVYLMDEKYAEAIRYFQKTIDLCDSLKITNAKGTALVSMAICYERVGDFKKALDYEFKSLYFNRQLKDTIEEGFSLLALAVTFEKQRQYDRALDFSNQALKIFDNTRYLDPILTCHNNIGIILHKTGKPEKALESYSKALVLAKELDIPGTQGMILHNMGIIYEEMGEYDKAMKTQLKAVAFSTQTQDDYSTSKNYMSLAELFRNRKDSKSELLYARKAFEHALKADRMELLAECYETLANAEASNGNLKEAFRLQSLVTRTKDSIFNTETARQLAHMETIYETDKKEKEITLLTKENEIREEKMVKQRIITYSVSGGLLLLAAMSLLTYRRYREKKKSNLELQEKNEAITRQKQEIEVQHSVIETKNKDITDSINYAKRIQTSFLPPLAVAEKILPEHFIYYRPKDIVSGDFYWIGNNNELGEKKFLVATADCTGHGVPGAFMSIIGVSLLNDIVIKQKNYSPDRILNELRTGIVKAMNPEGSEVEAKDGMDVSVCFFDLSQMKLDFAGANNSVWIVRGEELIELKADKFPVGKSINDDKPFMLQSIELKAGDCIYSFTDGFADQFGGPQGKKFKRKQMQELLLSISARSMSDQHIIIDNAFSSWMGNHEQIDDVCLIGLRIKG